MSLCNCKRVGQTKTAPDAEDDVPVTFAFASCQDYIGHYYNLFAASHYFATGGLREQALGREQEAWLTATVTHSDATWRVIGNSVSFTSLQTDFSGETPLPAELASLLDAMPIAYRNRFYLNVDHWDGFPNKRQELVTLFDSVPNTLLIAGDIHANFVAQHGEHTYEFTGTAISSSIFGSGVGEQLETLGIPATTVQALDALLQVANPSIRYANSKHNGVAIMRLDGQVANVTYYELTPEDVAVSYYDDRETLNAKFMSYQFTVQDGILQQVS